MKAILLNQNNTLSLGNLDTPEPAAGQVRIKIVAAGFNPIDYSYQRIKVNNFGSLNVKTVERAHYAFKKQSKKREKFVMKVCK